MKKISAEDTRKLRELNRRVQHHLTNGEYGEDGEEDRGIADTTDQDAMRRSTSKQALHDLTSHVDRMLDTENPNPDGD